MSENIVRFVDKIPFDKTEIQKAVESIVLSALQEMKEILLQHSNYFAIKNTDLVCCFNEQNYFVFNNKLPKVMKDEPLTDYVTPFLREIEITEPNLSQLVAIHSAYQRENPQKRRFDFVGDISGKTVWTYKDTTWKKTDWTENISGEAYPVFISILENTKSIPELLLALLKHELEPVEFSSALSEKFDLISFFSEYLSIKDDRFAFNPDGLLNLDSTKYKYNDEINQVLLKQLGLELPVDSKNITDYLLNCEKIRCDMDKYPEALITGTDSDAGLWNFWTDAEPQYGFPLPDGLKITARDPNADIVEDGIIAIDFGTSSTVVVRRNQNGIPIQMSIGKDNKYENPTLIKIFSLEQFMKAYKARDGRPHTKWEDLWVSHAVYNIFAGKSLKEEEVSSILYQIKQWAANDKKNTVIKPVNDAELTTLKSLTDILDSEDFNPIEIYAYFIGLYINNRQKDHGIYLNYYMSFPAAYDKNTKKNIRESFERGLKKSIPASVFKDGKHELKVYMEVSEPEAYAAEALFWLGFSPADGQPVNYAIFDFGGGTSDFAYGYWKKPSEEDRESFTFVLENKTTDGDKYLGGENLLEGLAFTVFADQENLKKLDDVYTNQGYKCKFNYGIPEQEMAGVPTGYLSDQQPAKKNMREMAEEMRKYWENGEKYFSELLNDGRPRYSTTDIEHIINKLKEKIQFANLPEVESELDKILNGIKNGSESPANAHLKIERIKQKYKDALPEDDEDPDAINFTLTLSSENIKDGETQHGTPEVPFTYSKKKIYEYLETKITGGVDSFFSKLEYTFFKEDPSSVDGKKRVNIFLAGNSSRSPILRKVMEKKVIAVSSEFKTKYNIEPVFKIYSPLGSDKVFDEMKELLHEQEVSPERIERILKKKQETKQRPTEKTGVAFGLLELVGGSIKVERDNTDIDKFMFYLGKEKVDIGIKLFEPFSFKDAKPELGKWYSVFKVNESRKTYTILYTADPKCLTGELDADQSKLKSVSFPQTKKGEHIWIRAISAKAIEYVLAETEEQADEKIKEKRQIIEFD